MRLGLIDSIAGRTMGVLLLGLFATVAASLAVFMTDVFNSSGWRHTSSLIERIALVASVADRLPANQRAVLAEQASQPGLRFAWPAERSAAPMASDLMTQHLARDIAAAAAQLGLRGVEAGIVENPAVTDAPAPGRANEELGIEVWLRLSDQSKLTVQIGSDTVGALSTERLLVSLLVLVLGVASLAVWAARKTIAPLGRFAAAAEQLGTDVNAPPISEQGPSEIRQAARAFNRMQGRLQRFVADRTIMLGAISHDLRTVLTRLALRIEYIEAENQRERALADLQQMDRMLASNLAFARDDFSSEITVPVDIAVQLQSLCSDLADAGHAVFYTGPAHFTYAARPTALGRVFTNLIGNALQYGGEAAVSLNRVGSSLVISVVDRGPGISLELRESVFAPFFRADQARGGHVAGSGLGLTVARTIVRGHGGDIELQGAASGGLEVRVQLPA